MSLKQAQMARAQELVAHGVEFLIGLRTGAKAAWSWLRACKDLLENMDPKALGKVEAALCWDEWAEMMLREKLGLDLSRDTIRSVVDGLDELLVEHSGRSFKRRRLRAIASGLVDLGLEFVTAVRKSAEEAWEWMQLCASLSTRCPIRVAA